MAAPNVRNIQYAKARLIKDPSTTAGDAPYGGTYLGLQNEVVAEVSYGRYEIAYVEYGGITGRILENPATAKITCMMRGTDADAINAVWGSGGAKSSVATPSKYSETRAAALLVAPLDVELPAFYLPRAIGIPAELMPSKYSRHQERVWRVEFIGIPDAAGRLFVQDPLEDISL